jgi:hypothetical protein
MALAFLKSTWTKRMLATEIAEDTEEENARVYEEGFLQTE